MKTHIILTKRNGNLILVPHAQLAAESDEQKKYTTISFPIPDTSGIIVRETIHEVEAKIADATCERG